MRVGELTTDAAHLAAPPVAAATTVTVTDMQAAAAVLSYLVAAGCTLFLAWWKTRPARKDAIEQAHEQALLCRDCRGGAVPPVCPVPSKYRPSDCPLTNKKKSMKKTKIVSVLFGGALACAVVLGGIAALAQGAPLDGASPVAEVDTSGLSGFFVGLAVKFPWLATVLLIIGGLRCIFKPVMVLVDGYVKANCSAEEYARLQAFEAGPIYRWLNFGLDFVGSVKLPVIKKAEMVKAESRN